jgi:hypothetical protein
MTIVGRIFSTKQEIILAENKKSNAADVVCDGPGSGPDQCCDPKPPTFKRARRRYPLNPGPTRSARHRAGAPPPAAAVSLPSPEKNANYCPPGLPRPAV